MNKTHRTLWNPALNSWVAAPETARTHRRSGPCATLSALAAKPDTLRGVLTAVAAATVLIGGLGTSSAWSATPGSGGSDDVRQNVGGSSGSGGMDGFGSAGAASSQGNGGYGGSGVGGSPAGGAVNQLVTSDTDILADVTGGAGGNGGAQALAPAGGGGGTGVYLQGTGLVLTNNSTITGGLGGNGGNGTRGGGAGGGGNGVDFADGGTLTNTGAIVGGAGGTGGSGTLAGGGGGGGHGVAGANLTIQNAGTITGGAAGAGGGGTVPGPAGTAGAAVYFTGGTNTLQLNAGSAINGAIWIGSGADGTIQANNGGSNVTLSGPLLLDGNVTIETAPGGNDLTQSGVVSGAGSLTKINDGTLTLTGANSYSGGTRLQGGRINVGNSTALGTGTLDMSSNTELGFTANGLNVGNAITVNTSVTIDSGSFNDTLSGVISGNGWITKTGSGTLTLAGANTHNSTSLQAGRINVGNNTALGSGGLTMMGGTALGFAAADLDIANAITVFGTSTIDTGSSSETLSGFISGIGSLTKTGAGALTISGPNTYLGGTQLQAGRINVGNDGALGLGSLTMATGTALGFAAGSLNIANGIALNGAASVDTGSSDQTLSGVIFGAGSLTKTGTGALTISGANNYLGGTQLQAGSITVGSSTALGLGTLTMTSGTALGFAASGLDIANPIALNGAVVIDTGSASDTLSGAISGTGGISKTGAGTLTLSGSNNYAGGTVVAAGTLRAGSALALTQNRPYALTGGTLDLNGYDLSVSSLMGTAGTVNLGSAALTVDQGTSSTTFAGTITGTGSLVMSSAGRLTLTGASDYSGGTQLQTGQIYVGNDSALGTGQLGMSTSTTLGFSANATLANAVSLGGSAEINTGAFDAVLTGDISGGGLLTKFGSGTLTLTGDGSSRTGGTQLREGRLNVGHIDALGASGAVQLSADTTLGFNVNVLVNNSIQLNGAGSHTIDTGGFDVATSNSVLGIGGLVKEGAGTLALAGGAYSGGTTVNAGTLLSSSASGFPQDTAYTVNGGTLDLGGYDLAASSLGGAGGTINLGAAVLTVNQNSDSSFAGALTGTGSLVKDGSGTLALTGSSSHAGGTRLLNGRIDVGHDAALGTGTLDMADGTTLGFTAGGLNIANNIALSGVGDPVIDTGSFDETLSGAISGTGFLTKEGSGTLTLAGANNYSGPTTVAAGTLAAGAANTLSASSVMTVASGATLDLAGHSQTLPGLTNSGTVNLNGSTPGATLTVTGPWVGHAGLLKLGTSLGTSGSTSDKLLLSGASAVASGSTAVQITNLGGLGALTTGDGIQIISAENGASIQPGAFSLAGIVSAGAYDYHIAFGSTGAYLSSRTDGSATDAKPSAPLPTYRAEAPLLAALPEQLRETGLAMLGNLHQRVGDETAPAGSGDRQAWGRVMSVERDIDQQGTTSARSRGRQSGFQAGTDLWATQNWRAGLYVGQLDGDMAVNGFARGTMNYAAGSNDLRSQFVGGYATYLGAGGFYVDTVLQGGRLRYTTSPSLALSSSGKGDSLLASVEVGQALQVAPGWTIEPQLQVANQRVDLDDITLVGATVQQDTDSSWLVRAGVRVKGEVALGAGKLQPYGRVNVYRRGSGTDTARFIAPAAVTDIASRTGGTSSELAAGATWQITPAVAAYGEAGRLWASGGDARTAGGWNGSVGVKVRW